MPCTWTEFTKMGRNSWQGQRGESVAAAVAQDADARTGSGGAASRLLPRPDIGPDLVPVPTDLAHDPANLGTVGKGVKLADEGGTLGAIQLGGERGQNVLDDTECRFTGKAGGR